MVKPRLDHPTVGWHLAAYLCGVATPADYWEKAEFPFELVPKLKSLGIGGGTIKGYGCAVRRGKGARGGGRLAGPVGRRRCSKGSGFEIQK